MLQLELKVAMGRHRGSGWIDVLSCRISNGQRVFSLSYNMRQTLIVLKPMLSGIGEEHKECVYIEFGVCKHTDNLLYYPIWQVCDEVAHHYRIRNERWGWESRLWMRPNTHTHTPLTRIWDSIIELSSHSQAKCSSGHSIILPCSLLYYVEEVTS